MIKKRMLLAIGLALGLAWGATPGHADAYPTRPIRLIVAFGAGGGPDTIARVVAAGLERQLGKPVVVENAPGASGLIALRSAARAEPDGHVLMMADMSFAVAPHFAENADIRPLERFQAVGWAATAPLTLIVSSSLPATSLEEFVALARTRPDEVMIGHTGVGTTPYLAAASFSEAAGIGPRLIPYRVIGDAMTNAMSGLISGLFSAASSAITAKNSTNLRVLAQTGDVRIPQLADVPTFAERGYTLQGFEHGTWFGLVTPAGTPAPIVRKLAEALEAIKQDKESIDRLAVTGAAFKAEAPLPFQQFLEQQDEVWRKLRTQLQRGH